MVDKKSDDDKDPKEHMTGVISLVLLSAFVVSLGITLILNGIAFFDFFKIADKESKNAWFELLKFLLIALSTALTTIIGYYFGQKEGNLKSQQAGQKMKENDKKLAKKAQFIYSSRNQEAFDNSKIFNDSPFQQSPSADESDDIILPQI